MKRRKRYIPKRNSVIRQMPINDMDKPPKPKKEYWYEIKEK